MFWGQFEDVWGWPWCWRRWWRHRQWSWCFVEISVFRTSPGFFLCVFLVSLRRRGARGGKARSPGCCKHYVTPKNGLNGSAVLHLSEPLVHVRCVGGCEFTAVTSSLCPDLSSSERRTHMRSRCFIVSSVLALATHCVFRTFWLFDRQRCCFFSIHLLFFFFLPLPSFSHCLSRPPTHTLKRTLGASCCCK